MIRLSTVLVLLLLSSDVLGYSSPLVTKPGRVIRKSIIDHIRFFGNITCKYATDPSINFLELWERDSMNPDDHLSQTVVLDQTIYPYKYDIHAIDDGDEWGSNNYSFWTTLLQEWIPRNEKRPVGRPPMRWADSLKKEISVRQGTQLIEPWSTIAKDRKKWIAVIRAHTN